MSLPPIKKPDLKGGVERLNRTLRVRSVSPRQGWPGTQITISGSGFTTKRDDVVVTIGTERCLVVSASKTKLVLLAGENTVSGPITLKVGLRQTKPGRFDVLPMPDPTDITKAGPPRFFHGPQHGTPTTNVADQKVLVMFVYPTDQDPGLPAARAALLSTEITGFDDANRYWKEASFSTTSWAMTYSDWLALPYDWSAYFWGSSDIEKAELRLFQETAHPLARQGDTIFHGTPGGLSRVRHTAPLSWSFGVGLLTDGSKALALRQVGTVLYAGTAKGGFFIYDISDPQNVVTVGSTAIANVSIWSIDISGTKALLSLGRNGDGMIDIATPSAPVVQRSGSAGGGTPWALAKRTQGARVYSGQGTQLRIEDLSGTALTAVATLDFHAIVTGIDISGTTCVVTTDGNGAFVLALTATGADEKAHYLDQTRIRSVTLDGARAYLCANAAGLQIVDLTKLDAPKRLGGKALKKGVYTAHVSPAEVIVAPGSVTVVAMDVGDPADPKLIGTEANTGNDWDIAVLQDQLTVASNSNALVKSSDRLFIDSLKAYFAATGTGLGDLAAFEGFIVVANGPGLRGQSGTDDHFAFDVTRFQLGSTKGHIYLSRGSAWGRKAHEIGHWLGMWDIYEENYADGTTLPGTGAPWCLSGNHDDGPLFCGHHLHEVMKFYRDGDVAIPATNVVELAWSPTDKRDETFILVAHDKDRENIADRYHAIRLVAASGLIYYVEVRQKPDGLIFDQNLPIPAGDSGRVIVTRITEGVSFSNTFERPIQLMDSLVTGGKVVDAARNLVIEVLEKIDERPLAYRVRVQWNQPVAGDPNGAFDLTITPWSTKTWETPDIWIDSPRNGAGVYEFTENGSPILSGDRPWVKHENTIYARIRNTGPQAVPEAWVTCSITSPPGIGDNGQWSPLATQHLTNIPGHDPAVPGSGEVVLAFPWRPEADKHTCIQIAINPQPGEIQTDNNRAQENVAHFDSASGSSHAPVILEAEVRSPFSVWRKVDLRVFGLPQGWHAVVDRGWVWLPGKGAAPARAIIYTTLGTSPVDDRQTPRLALPRVEGWTYFGDRLIPIGGILAPVRATAGVTITFEIKAARGAIYVGGRIAPALKDVPITVEITDAKGGTFLLYTKTSASGAFDAATREAGIVLKPGQFTVQAFTTSGGAAAQTESEIKTVTLPN